MTRWLAAGVCLAAACNGSDGPATDAGSGGAATGGAIATGGAVATGGAPATTGGRSVTSGGSTSTGGATGGAAATGGSPANGGSSTVASGGRTETGGAAGSATTGGALDGSGGTPPRTPNALVFSRTQAYRHESIPTGVKALTELGKQRGWQVTATEDATAFSDAGLAPFNVVVFLSTTGDVLDDAQQAAFERFIRAGNGYVGIHAASDTEYDWPWYGQLVGAYFKAHPEIQTAKLVVEDSTHPSTAHLSAEWQRRDEWYGFRSNPRDQVQVLLRLDESSYTAGDGSMGTDHPIAWCREFDGGRAFYTGLGHTNESYAEAPFLDHVAGGVEWAARVENSR